MESSDIGQVYDFERNGEAAANRLANYPLQWSTGIDYLIVVIRHIYCNTMMSLELHKEWAWFEESEAGNPILVDAWHMFGREIERAHSALMSLRCSVKKPISRCRIATPLHSGPPIQGLTAAKQRSKARTARKQS